MLSAESALAYKTPELAPSHRNYSYCRTTHGMVVDLPIQLLDPVSVTVPFDLRR